MIFGNFANAVKGVLHLPESGYRMAPDGSGVIWLVGESDSAGATSPCFQVALPEIKGYIVRASAMPYPGAEPTATLTITLKDRFAGSWSYAVTTAGSKDFKAGNPAPALDGPLELSIDTLGAASKKVLIALIVSETPTGPAGAAGTGLEAGGAAGAILQKDSSTDYDTSWLAIGTKGKIPRVTNAATALEYVSPLNLSADRDSILAQTVARDQLIGTSLSITAGTLYLGAVRVRLGVSIATMGFMTGFVPATTPTNWWLAIYDTALNLLNQTADQLTAALAANTVYEIALTSAYAPTADTTVYFGLMIAAGVAPSIARAQVTNTAISGILPMLGSTSTTGLTTTPPDPASALTAIGQIPWIYGK